MNLGVSRKEVIQVISEIGQADYYPQAENYYYLMIWEDRLSNLKRHIWLIKYQVMTVEK